MAGRTGRATLGGNGRSFAGAFMGWDELDSSIVNSLLNLRANVSFYNICESYSNAIRFLAAIFRPSSHRASAKPISLEAMLNSVYQLCVNRMKMS